MALSHPFLGWEGSPTKIDYRKKRYPYSNLSTGGPSSGDTDMAMHFNREPPDLWLVDMNPPPKRCPPKGPQFKYMCVCAHV